MRGVVHPDEAVCIHILLESEVRLP
jgi:hypothetical protein